MNRAQRRQQAKLEAKSKYADTRTGIEVVIAKPPVWDSVCALLQAQPLNAVFTYGNRIYNPAGETLRDDIIEHEKIHMEQQDHSDTGAALWWGKFLRDVDFRIEQEARAYGRQYEFLCARHTGHEHRTQILSNLGRMLSGPLYGHSLSLQAAMVKIKEYSGVK